ncbi:hypothetical protein F4810DRAFT_285901 [Camillea tinctor]|nr:hypothetical protein F4810DRAFT_285901 [Camillea tinctor]
MSNQQYFISPGGHLRSSQNDLELPSDPIASGSSNPDVERSSTATMTRRGLRRTDDSDADSPLRHASTRPKRRETEEYDKYSQTAQPPQILFDNDNPSDNDYPDDVTSVFPEAEDDDDYELPGSESDDDDDDEDLVIEMKRPAGRNKVSQRKPRISAKGVAEKPNRKKPQPKKKPGARKSSANPSRPRKSKQDAEQRKGGQSQSIPVSTLAPPERHDPSLSMTIPDSQPTEMNTQLKLSNRGVRVAKKPFYDESTGSQRKQDSPAQATSTIDSALQREKPNSDTHPSAISPNIPAQENKSTARKKRTLPNRKQPESKRLKLDDDKKTNTDDIVPSFKDLTRLEQRSDSNSDKANKDDGVEIDIIIDSTSEPLEEAPWETYATPVSTIPGNGLDQENDSDREARKKTENNANSLHATKESLQVVGPKKRSHVQYGLRENGSKRIAEQVSKIGKTTATKGSSLENTSSDPSIGSRQHNIEFLADPLADPRAKQSEPSHGNISTYLDKLSKNGAGLSEGRELDHSTATHKKLQCSGIEPTDPNFDYLELKDEEHELSDTVTMARMVPSRPISRKPNTPEKPVSRVTSNLPKGANIRSTYSRNDAHGQSFAIQVYSPVTSPREYDNPETRTHEAQHGGFVDYHENQPARSMAHDEFRTRQAKSLTGPPQSPKIVVVEPLRPHRPLHQFREVISQTQTVGVNPYNEQSDTGNNLLSIDHNARVSETEASILHSNMTNQHLPGHTMVGPSGSPHTTRRKVDFPQHTPQEAPKFTQLNERPRYKNYDDPFRPILQGDLETNTQSLKPRPGMSSELNYADGEHSLHRNRPVECGPLQWPQISSASLLPRLHNSQGSAMNMEYRAQTSKHPIDREVQFHPKSVDFASKASQSFQNAEERPALQQDASENMESTMDKFVLDPPRRPVKPSDVSMPVDINQQNSRIRQKSKWEQAVDAACNGIADSMHQISLVRFTLVETYLLLTDRPV